MLARLYRYDAVLQRLPQHLQDIAAALGLCIQKAHASVGQRHLARQRHVAPPDQPHIGDSVRGARQGGGRDPRPAVAGEAGDAVEARGLKGLGQGHRRQDGGEPPGQQRLARPRGAEQEQMIVRTPASPSPFRGHLDMTAANMAQAGAEVAQVPHSLPYHRGGIRPGVVAVRSGERLQQRLGLLQVGRVKAFGEPAVDRRQQRMGFALLTLLLPQASEAHGGP
jgi:hypothetical protein